jgi:hypothetical protein
VQHDGVFITDYGAALVQEEQLVLVRVTTTLGHLTFKLLHIEPDRGDYVRVLLLLRLEVVQQGRLP